MKNNCENCGNNPVPHFIFWYNESLNIFLTPIRQKLFYNPIIDFFKKIISGRWLSLVGVVVFRTLKVISVQSDMEKCKVARAKVLWEEAGKRGVVMQELLLFGRPFDTYLAEKNQRKIVFSGLPRPENYSNKWLDLMDDKSEFKQLMKKNNLPVPLGASCSNFSQAKIVYEKIKSQKNPQWAIVKPRSGSRGRHSTTFVNTESELEIAFKIAKQLCYWVMVEQQLGGPVYRATVVNFELCGVLRGDPPQVVGDGKHSIVELVETKNLFSHPGVKSVLLDKSIEKFLERQNLVLSFVPQVGQMVNLSEKIGVNYGGSSSEDFDLCHPDNKELFVRASKVLGDPIVGFDFIIPDIVKSYKEQQCGFIEVNSLPFINLHHNPLHGTPRNVAEKVWQMAGM